MDHQRLDATEASGAPGHPHSLAVRTVGDTQWHIAGTVGCTPTRELVDDMGVQAERTINSLEASLLDAGARVEDVASVTIYTTDFERYEAEALPKLHAFLDRARPALTVLGVPRLADPDYLIEIEATAVGTTTVRPSTPTAHVRTNPFGLYPPSKNAYSQVLVSRGSEQVHVSGLTGHQDDGTMPIGMGTQAEQLVSNLDAALHAAGAERRDVVRINLYVTDMPAFRSEAGQTVFGAFGADKPTSTLIAVDGLADADAVIGMTATAITQEREDG